MPSASSGRPTGNSTGRVANSPSTAMAISRSTPKLTQRCHSGRKASTARISMKVAKASLSQMPFHQRMVTRSPNHMWAISWQMTSAIRSSSTRAAWSGSTNRTDSRKVTHPRFSMAPKAKSGIGHEVELVGRVGDAEVVGEEAQGMAPDFQGVAGEVRLAHRMDDAERHPVDVHRRRWPRAARR